MSNILLTRDDVIPTRYTITDFSNSINIHAKFCVCGICMNLIRIPIMISGCDHYFCANCLIPKIEGKVLSELRCPSCNSDISSFENIRNSLSMERILGSLKSECKLGCGNHFAVCRESQKLQHEVNCEHQKNKNESLKITKLQMQTASLVVKSLVSKEGLVSLPSGGPRVS